MTHIQEIQTALDYIEMNLHEELTLDEISKVVGFSNINIGVLLTGKGQIWFDNADLQEVDYNTPTTEFVPEEVFPDHILNQSFEEF
ncbi:helix-turn-helix transcriptional regulator [Clostridium botulinum]|uniref:helix-turn-helix transcriptional regulator n=1 Tax=Clostridium botulinum TaxID=1491 RepID=UPI0004DAE7BE|nr:helix-turn-helix transcriptional regulator [Clostridium botulinum]KEI01874.1 hypothetical protein Z953_08350 [Clostridium botulinum D str. 16868]